MHRFIAIALLSLTTQSFATESDTLPAGYKFEGIDFIYDKGQCGGDIGFKLDPANGDCTVEFNDFYLVGDGQRECDLTIVVNLPRNLAIAPSRLFVEGDYQLGPRGVVTFSADYRMQGGESIDLWERWEAQDQTQSANTFLSENYFDNRRYSPCGAQAIFRGKFKLTAQSRSSTQSIIDIGRTDLGLDKTQNPKAYWGWDYQTCD
jgi:hypothetical protein